MLIQILKSILSIITLPKIHISSQKTTAKANLSKSYEPSGFKEGQARELHISGTALRAKLPDMLSKASDITTRPFRAFCKSLQEDSIKYGGTDLERELYIINRNCLYIINRNCLYIINRNCLSCAQIIKQEQRNNIQGKAQRNEYQNTLFSALCQNLRYCALSGGTQRSNCLGQSNSSI